MRAKLDDALAKKHGFTSAAQVARFEVRIAVAAMDQAGDLAVAKPLPTLGSLEAGWKKDGLNEDELAARRETYRQAEVTMARAKARLAQRGATQKSLASSGYFEGAGREVIAEAESQPPLSEDEGRRSQR